MPRCKPGCAGRSGVPWPLCGVLERPPPLPAAASPPPPPPLPWPPPADRLRRRGAGRRNPAVTRDRRLCSPAASTVAAMPPPVVVVLPAVPLGRGRGTAGADRVEPKLLPPPLPPRWSARSTRGMAPAPPEPPKLAMPKPTSATAERADGWWRLPSIGTGSTGACSATAAKREAHMVCGDGMRLEMNWGPPVEKAVGLGLPAHM